MTMTVTQVRLPQGIIEEVNKLVEKGFYTNKSDVVRDALRRLILDKQVGSIQNTGDSVEEVRTIRKKLSKEAFDFDTINKLGK